jgi:hypothetical protein
LPSRTTRAHPRFLVGFEYGDENLYFSGMEFNKMCINRKQIHLKINTSFLCTTYIFIKLCIVCLYWCPERFIYQMMFVSYSSYTTGVTCRAATTEAISSSPGFSGVRVARSLVFCEHSCVLGVFFGRNCRRHHSTEQYTRRNVI